MPNFIALRLVDLPEPGVVTAASVVRVAGVADAVEAFDSALASFQGEGLIVLFPAGASEQKRALRRPSPFELVDERPAS